jgi:hypothetical protein
MRSSARAWIGADEIETSVAHAFVVTLARVAEWVMGDAGSVVTKRERARVFGIARVAQVGAVGTKAAFTLEPDLALVVVVATVTCFSG